MSGAALPRAALTYRQTVQLARIGVVILALLLWQLIVIALGDTRLVPGPLAVVQAAGRLLADGPVMAAIGATLVELAGAFALSVLFGGIVGYWLGTRRQAGRIGLPILLMLYALPQITILPLFILYFGLGPAGKIAFGVSHGLFPVALSVQAGLQQTRPHFARWATSLGASPWQRFYRLSLPQLIPILCTGMRLAMSMTLLGVLLAELYVSSLGIGFYVQLYTNALQGDSLFALVLLLAAIAIALNQLVGLLERRTARWKP